jgi:hypothetical protein
VIAGLVNRCRLRSPVPGLRDCPSCDDHLLCAGGGYNPSDLSSYFAGLGIAEPRVTAVSVNGATNSPTPPAAPPTLTPMARSHSTSKSPDPSPPERMLEGHIAGVTAVAFSAPMVSIMLSFPVRPMRSSERLARRARRACSRSRWWQCRRGSFARSL